ncbi:MAG: hypothetical protein HRT58_14070 [Crocinitomicaceae bacterium]|nr:hypothetical protein [Flavobacteriales bacterium]NQZ36791.1 hypothetical protein [Crocinitomicaceae bacterium]
MSLASSLQAESVVSFPSFDSPLGFFSDMNEFAAMHFRGFKSVEVYKGLTIYAGSPDESEITTDAYVKELNGVHFINNNKRQEAFDPDLDVRLATIKVFISHDGAFLLRKYNSLKGKLKDNEVALFLEYSSRNIISNSVTLLLAGDKAKKYVASILKSDFIQEPYYLSLKKQERLVESVIGSSSLLDAFLNIAIQTHDYIVGQVSEYALSFFGVIESFFSETLRIPESFWNVDAEGSVMGQVGNAIESQLKGVEKSINSFIRNYDFFIPLPIKLALDGIKNLAKYALEIFQEARKGGEFFIALVCGIWNSVMDTIAGIFGLIKLVIRGVTGAAKMVNGAINYATKSDYYNALATEYLDNLLHEAIKIDWQEVIREAKKEMFEIANLMIQLPSLVWGKVTDLNSSEVGYYVGYIIFELISFIFPPIKIAQLAKFGKWTKFDKIRKASNAFPDPKTSKAANKVDEFFEFIQPLIKTMKQGTEGFKDFVRNILRSFRAWVEGLFTNIMKTSDEVTELFRRGKVTTAKGEVRFKRSELALFSKKIENKYRHLNLKINLVTPNSKLNRLRLKRWDKRNVLGSFNPGPPPVIHVRQRCTHLTMQHEIWHLEDYNRLGVMEYKKNVNWKHEESVWLKILNTKDQWTQNELIESYRYYKQSAFDEGASPILNMELEKLI